MSPDKFGVYVHVPFCAQRCDYCAFATWTDRHPLMARYVDAVLTEIDQARSRESLPAATTVFFGGGTPSQLPGPALVEILSRLELASGAEVTVECNPEDASAELFAAWRHGGVTRVSLGVQSMVVPVLESLGRLTRPPQVGRALALAAESGIEDRNVDLIFGAAAESDQDWEHTLAAVLALHPGPTHVSAYALTVEPGTPLADDPRRHPDDDTQAERYHRADEMLKAAGFEWYEVSNWAQPGHQCRHNRLYWNQGDYRGFGCAAHSHRHGRRFWNIRSIDRYLEHVEQGRSTVAGEELLDEGRRRFEALALALRTDAGVPLDALPHDPDLDPLVDRSSGRAVLTVDGRLLANVVTARMQVPTILTA